jgi:GMP synthase (glutamine-hydrolysing)
VLGQLPERFDSFQWHYYTYDVPAGAIELARSRICTQAYRLGDNAWGVQFHPEVTLAQVQSWVDEKEEVPIDDQALMAETRERIGAWNALGRELCGAFVDAAERIATPA